MNWNDLKSSTGGQYLMTPEAVDETVEKGESGTKIVLTNINRISDFSEEFLVDSIARFFIFSEDFSVTIRLNDGETIVLSNDMHFSAFGEEFSWSFPKDFAHLESDYEHRSEISGKIITPESPIAPRFNSRGVSLFSRGKLVQLPYQFSDSASSNFYSYMTGWLKVDFIEDFTEDVISTNRQNINWGYLQTGKLHEYLGKCVQFVHSDWRKKRKDKKIADINKKLKTFNVTEWKNSIPEDIRDSFQAILEKIVEDFPEVGSEESKQIFSELKNIIPPYPSYHWRNLHLLIKDQLYQDYQEQKYLEAAKEGVVIL